MTTPRLNRLLASDGKCFDVAIDHGFFGEASMLAGIENLERAVNIVVAANPDAIQLTVGQARLLQKIPGKQKPSLVLRSDVANVYGTTLPTHLFSETIGKAVEQALRLDAACLVANLFMLPNQPEVHRDCIRVINSLKPECERNGLPLMLEPLVMKTNGSTGYTVDGEIQKILPLVRQAVELGADIIKADPCDNAQEYHRVIEIASGIPVLVRGGGRAPDSEILSRTHALMQQGAHGIVYGRNVVQHQNPGAMTRALMAIVHAGASANEAANILATGKQ